MEAWALRLDGEIASRREPLAAEAAARTYREALALATDLGMRPLMAHCHLGLGRLGRRTGRPDADAHLPRAAALAREMEMSLRDM